MPLLCRIVALNEITKVKPLAQGLDTQYVPQMLGMTATSFTTTVSIVQPYPSSI